jgi:hypothetical protein
LESETAEIAATVDAEAADEPSLESETAEIPTTIDAEATDAEVVDEPSLESETGGIDSENNTGSSGAEVVAAEQEETPVLETEEATTAEATTDEVPKAPIIGNYTYEDDEDDKAGTGFIWSPTNKLEEAADDAKENATSGLDAVTIATAAAGTGAAAILVNSTDAVKNKIENIVDFTPVTDKDKAKGAALNDTNIPNTGKRGGFISTWGWVIAACLIGVAVIAWLSTFLFGGGKDDKKSAEFLKTMRQELGVVYTKNDSLTIYKKYLAQADSLGISKDSATLIRTRSEALAAAISVQADTTGIGGGLANNATSPNSEKEAVTEASVKTNKKPQIAQNNPAAANGDKPANNGDKPAASPKKDEHKVAGSVQPKVKVISTKPAAGSGQATPVMQGRQARPTSYATPTLPPVPKADAWKSFDKSWAASEGFRVVKKGNKWGWMHEDGKPFVGLNYEEVGSFKNGFAPLKKGGKWGFTNNTGKMIVEYKYTSVTAFGATCPGLAKVNDGKRVFFIDKTGKEVPACK